MRNSTIAVNAEELFCVFNRLDRADPAAVSVAFGRLTAAEQKQWTELAAWAEEACKDRFWDGRRAEKRERDAAEAAKASSTEKLP
jgi:hypothetical protein